MSNLILPDSAKSFPNGIAHLKLVGDAVVQDGQIVARANRPLRNKVDKHTFRVAIEQAFEKAGYKVIWIPT